MTTLREAAEMALDALRMSHPYSNSDADLNRHSEVIAALRATLADPTCQESRQVKPMHPEIRKVLEDYFDKCFAAPTQRTPLQWHKAPVKTEWGEGMVESIVEIDKDHTLKLYCEHDQAAKVEAMMGAREPLADLVIADIYAKWDATTGVSMADFARAVERAHGIGGEE